MSTFKQAVLVTFFVSFGNTLFHEHWTYWHAGFGALFLVMLTNKDIK